MEWLIFCAKVIEKVAGFHGCKGSRFSLLWLNSGTATLKLCNLVTFKPIFSTFAQSFPTVASKFVF